MFSAKGLSIVCVDVFSDGFILRYFLYNKIKNYISCSRPMEGCLMRDNNEDTLAVAGHDGIDVLLIVHKITQSAYNTIYRTFWRKIF